MRQTFLLHPFTDTQRDTLGKFEIVRDIREPGLKDVKRSTFVTFQQLAELYAKGVLDEFGFSVRMCPGQGTYTAPSVEQAAVVQPAHGSTRSTRTDEAPLVSSETDVIAPKQPNGLVRHRQSLYSEQRQSPE